MDALPALVGLTPVAAAQALAPLPGMVFFDTAGHLPSGYGAPRSILAALPTSVCRGSIHRREDLRRLEELLAAGQAAGLSGGLCGWIGYAGDFCFGDYSDWLTYHHATGAWHGSPDLAQQVMAGLQPGEMDATALAIGPFAAVTTPEAFIGSVGRAQEWIAAGDIYQVNLSQAFAAQVHGGSLFSLYRSLRAASPAPVAAYLSLGGKEILSSSPETFLRFVDRSIETRPIKGTRPRFADPVADRRSAEELTSSAKERAELVMITDLLRNDLGQVCDYGSVEVAEMLQLETLGQVHHLVSTVRGTLRPGVSHLAALAACFPGGSITGAPKKRAMEIIAALEPVPRGVYCGALGYLGYQGDSQFNIAIRTLIRDGSYLSYHVGAGIVADSDPQKEYEETLHKAAGMRLAIERWAEASTSSSHGEIQPTANERELPRMF